MKQIALISSLLLALLCSCSQPEQPMPAPETPLHDSLTAFDTLMQTCPDSALFALLDFNETHNDLTPFDRHYADLLISEALFKSDYEQTTRPALRQSLSYFDSLAAAYPQNDDFIILSARSHYMNGVGLMEADSTLEACAEYLKALETVENHFDEKEIDGYKAKFMALTYNRLGDLFTNHFLTEQGIVCFKNAISFCKICPTSKYGLSGGMERIGGLYTMTNQTDSALRYFELARKHLPDTDNLVYRNIATSEALLMFSLGNDYEKSLEALSHVLSATETDDERNSRLLIISEILYKEGVLDSAKVCLESVFNSDLDLPYRLQAATYLQKIHEAGGEYDKANIYTNFMAPYATKNYEQQNTASQLADKFQDYQRSSTENKHNREKQLLWEWWIAIAAAAIILIAILVVWIKIRHKKKVTGLEDTLRKQEMQHTALVSRMKNANARMKEEKQRLLDEKNERNQEGFTLLDLSKYEELTNDPFCRHLMNRFADTDIVTTNHSYDYADLALGKKEERQLASTIEKYCPDFNNRIAKLYPEMGKNDLMVCQYFLLGFTEPQIAVLLQKSFSWSWRNSNRIKGIMGCQDLRQHLKAVLFNA